MTAAIGWAAALALVAWAAYALGFSRGLSMGAEERGRLRNYVDGLELANANLVQRLRAATAPPLSRRGAGDVVREIAVGDGSSAGSDVPVAHDSGGG